ncbi:unnamed protein product, partial [Symbiodinium pilosum]
MGIMSIYDPEKRQGSKKVGGLTRSSSATPAQLAARGSLTELLPALGSEVPPADVLRDEMRDFSLKDRVSAADVFTARWALQRKAAE